MSIDDNQEKMSALTERRKREIMELYQRRIVPRRIFLNIIYDISDINRVTIIERDILDSLERMTGIESYTPYQGRNIIAVTAQWTEDEAESRVAELMRIAGVLDVKAKVIEHGFTGPRIRS
jgi:hypothetical protein